jgi:hypothetical protein
VITDNSACLVQQYKWWINVDKDFKEKVLNNPDVKDEYDALEIEYDIIQEMNNARIK